METSLEVQPDDMTMKHRDGGHIPLERPQVLEKEEKVVADGTSSTDQAGDFVFQIEVGMNFEASHVAARHFELAMFQQQQGTSAKSTDRGEDPFNDWRGRGCNKFVPVLGGNGTKIVSTEDIFDQPPGQMR